jgi:hypothetical protein
MAVALDAVTDDPSFLIVHNRTASVNRKQAKARMSVGAGAAKHGGDGSEQDLEVAPNGVSAHVLGVKQ